LENDAVSYSSYKLVTTEFVIIIIEMSAAQGLAFTVND
jgi:hypothetical protein